MRPVFDFLSNGGEMGALLRAHDWAATPLGTPAQWPESLKTTLRLVLTSKHPMFIWWGPDLIQFYNDAYRQTMGPERHPAALGQAGRDCWAEIWDMIGPQIDSIMAGGDASWHEDQLVPVTRHGRHEDVWWTYGFSPVEDGEGVRGVLVVCNDVSKEHNSRAELLRLNQQLIEQIALREAVEQRQAFQLTLADRLRGLTGTDEIAGTATELLGKHLQVSHVYYTALDEGKGSFHIHHEWKLDSLPAIAGVRGELAHFGPEILAALRSGQIFAVGDTTLDPRTAPYAAAYASLGARACLVAPVIKAGKLVAALTLHQSCPCDWPSNQVALVEDVADRIWNAVERAGHALLVQQAGESERLHALFRQAPWFMHILRGPEHVFDFVNAAYVRMVGPRELLGKPMRAAFPELEGQGIFEQLDEVYESATPFLASDMAVVLHSQGGVPATQIYVDFVSQPMLDADGSVSGIFVCGMDVTERKLARDALALSRSTVRQLAEHQEMVMEDERKRIARDIHDELGQNLMALRIDMSMLAAEAATKPVARERLAAAVKQIDATIKSVRAIINDLRPAVLDLGLHAAIEWQAQEFERRSGIACELHIDHQEFDLDDKRATALFRIVQESLANILRHAQASAVRIDLQRNGLELCMKIADNGIGMPAEHGRKANAFGLVGIEERVHVLGGTFLASSDPGRGMALSVCIPIPERKAVPTAAACP